VPVVVPPVVDDVAVEPVVAALVDVVSVADAVLAAGAETVVDPEPVAVFGPLVDPVCVPP
jgi:hypothetical protein